MLAGSLIAILQALTMFGSPAILALPAGFHVITTKIWSLFQYPPKPGLAAAASLPLLLITVLLSGPGGILGPPRLHGARRQERRAAHHALGRWKPLALGLRRLACCLLTVILPYRRAARRRAHENGRRR